MEINDIFYSNSVKLKLTLNFSEESENNCCPMVILCHGHSRHKDDGLDVLAGSLAKAGIASMRFNFRGCGEDAENRYSLYCMSEWVQDLMNAISYASSLILVDSGRIGVAGISMGASTAVYTSAIDKRIKSTVSMAGISDCHEWLEGVWENSNGDFNDFENTLNTQRQITAMTGKSMIMKNLLMYNYSQEELDTSSRDILLLDRNSNDFVTADSLASLMEYKPIEKCPYIKNPIFYIHGEKDVLVPKHFTEDMYNATISEKKKLKIYPNVEHNIPLDMNRDPVFEDIVTWFKDSL